MLANGHFDDSVIIAKPIELKGFAIECFPLR